MAIFGIKEKKEAVDQTAEIKKIVSGFSSVSKMPVDIIIRPRITEKATDNNKDSVYVFEINSKADKISVKKAFFEIYKVKPIKVNISKNPAKSVFIRGKKGIKKGVKKAYIHLKKGDKIE